MTPSPSFGLLWWLDSFSIKRHRALLAQIWAQQAFSSFPLFFFFKPSTAIVVFVFLQSAHCWLSVLFVPSNVFILFSWQQLAEKTSNLRNKCKKIRGWWQIEESIVVNKSHQCCLLWNSQLRTTGFPPQRQMTDWDLQSCEFSLEITLVICLSVCCTLCSSGW